MSATAASISDNASARTLVVEKVKVPTRGTVFSGSFGTHQRGCDGHGVVKTRYVDHRTLVRRLWYHACTGWDERSIWDGALIETVGTMLLVYMSALMDVTFGNYGKWIPNWVGVTNIILLSLFILAASASSGGHLNPLITFSTMTTGLTGFPRGMLYMTAQLLGGAIGGGLVRGSFGPKVADPPLYNGGGCFYYPSSTVTPGQAFLIEMMSSFTLLFLAFGIALDPKQAQIVGPILGPIFVGLSLGLTSFASAGLSEGYAGAAMNPARCFAYAVARADFKYQWIWWVGPFAGSLLLTVLYRTVPPYKASKIVVDPVAGEQTGTKA